MEMEGEGCEAPKTGENLGTNDDSLMEETAVFVDDLKGSGSFVFFLLEIHHSL